ncbi:hypothetical protein MMC34_002686 [Xylographa carneopallida]|nr:hypothetical protein [Xylographa carneopallida]
MSAQLLQRREIDEERDIQRAIEASLQSSARSQLAQGNSSTRRKEWQALRSPYTRSDMEQEQSPYSSTGAEYSGYRENITNETDVDDIDEEEPPHMNNYAPPKLPGREEFHQAKMRAIAEGSSTSNFLADFDTIQTRPTIDDCIAELEQAQVVTLERLDLPDGDTLVFIDAPGKQPDQDEFTYHQIKVRYFNPFCMRSSTLKSLGSSFFDFLLSPTAQFRVLRRRKLLNKLPPGIKYVLDLTPPNEGDDAARLTASLSCKTGVRHWGLSCDRWMISAGLVGGQDELSRLKAQSKVATPNTKIQWTKGKGTAAETLAVNKTASSSSTTPPKTKTQWMKGKGTVTETVVMNEIAGSSNTTPKTPDQKSTRLTIGTSPVSGSTPGFVRGGYFFQLPADYTPVRHRFAIERVLNAIEGRDPKIDSAVKLWTTFAVAQHFGIRGSLLTDYIVRWLRAPPNTYFMEVQPEVVLKIAEGLQCQAVGRDVFAILVGEAALAVVSNDHTADPHYSLHGRRKEFVNEIHFEPWLTRIQYARDVLVERVKAQFEELTSMTSTWVDELPECQKLLALTHKSTNHQSLYDDLMKALKTYVRGAIYYLLCSTYNSMPGPVEDSGKGAELFPQTQFCSTWNLLTYQERIFTRAFWNNLRGCSLIVSNVNYGVKTGYNYDVGAKFPVVLKDLVKAGVFKTMYPHDLLKKVNAYCSMNEYGIKNPITATGKSPAYNDTYSDQHPAWLKEGSSAEKRGWNLLSSTTFNISYRPKRDNTGFSFDFAAAGKDWRQDYVETPGHSSYHNLHSAPMSGPVLDAALPSDRLSNGRSLFYSQAFPELRHLEYPYDEMPVIDEMFYDDDDESPAKRRFSKASEESFAHLQARHAEMAEDDKRELEELHTQNRCSFTERRQHPETLCTGRPPTNPYSNFDPFAEDEDTVVTDPFADDEEFGATGSLDQRWLVPRSPYKNLLSVGPKRGQSSSVHSPTISKIPAPKPGRRLGSFNGGPLTFENDFLSTLSQARKTRNFPQPASANDSLDHKSDTLDATASPPQEAPFSLQQFFTEVERHIHSVATAMLAAPDADHSDPLELGLTNTLVCLQESEMKFLPLWASGNDDGSSGVFSAHLPPAEPGFTTAGPPVRVFPASSTAASSDFSLLLRGGGTSTARTSTAVHDGFADSLDRRRVYDDDSEWGAILAAASTAPGSSDSTWADDDFAASRADPKGKGKGVDRSLLVSFGRLVSPDPSVVAEEEGNLLSALLAKEEEEDYGKIFMYDEHDEGGSGFGSEGGEEKAEVEEELYDISNDADFWDDAYLNDSDGEEGEADGKGEDEEDLLAAGEAIESADS